MGADMEFRYVIYYSRTNRPVGIACFQVVDLEDRGSTYGDKLCHLGKRMGSRLFEDRRVRCLVSGNVFPRWRSRQPLWWREVTVEKSASPRWPTHCDAWRKEIRSRPRQVRWW